MSALAQLAQISGVVGAALPLLISVIQRASWSESTRSLVAFGACVVAAGVAAVAAGDLTLTNYGTSLLVVFGTARTTYAGLWKPTGVAGKVEDATTPAQGPQAPAQGTEPGEGSYDPEETAGDDTEAYSTPHAVPLDALRQADILRGLPS